MDMISAFEIKDLAKRLGYDVPNWSDEEVLTYIAQQLGLSNYIYGPENNEKLFSALKDVERRQFMDDFWDDTPSGLENTEILDDISESQNDYQNTDAKNGEEKESDDDLKKADESQSDDKSSVKKDEDNDSDVKKDKKTTDEKNPDNSLTRKQLPSSQQNNGTGNVAGVNNANKNLEYAKRVRGENNLPVPTANPKPAKVVQATKDSKKGEVAKKIAAGAKKAVTSIASFFKNVVLPFLAAHPWLIFVILGVFLLILILIICFAGDASSKSRNSNGAHCSYDLSGVIASGNVQLNDLQVELINCDGIESNYTVLETVDFEKYVLGVALAEIGPDAPDEAIKSQIIAARNFALTRNQGMCPGNSDDCFYGYNASTGKIRLRACEADQVYWNYDKNIYREDRGAISIYSPEISSGTLWKSALSSERKKEVLALADEVKGKVLLDNKGDVLKLAYNATTSTQFVNGANDGQSYDKILASVYDVGGMSSASCTTTSEIDYKDYVLSSDGDTILHEDLATFLTKNGSSLEAFNQLISNNVKDAGYGTRAGVVAAAVTLIAELGNNYDVKIPYFWGGGHAGGIHDLASGSWGSSSCSTFANNQSYNYCGLDCSGFVPWAIRNGGFNMQYALLANQFQNMSGAKKVTLSKSDAVVQPGDLLESRGHVVLVVGIDYDNKKYICAEASGNEYGIWFTRRSFNENGFWGVKLDDYYNNKDNVRS